MEITLFTAEYLQRRLMRKQFRVWRSLSIPPEMTEGPTLWSQGHISGQLSKRSSHGQSHLLQRFHATEVQPPPSRELTSHTAAWLLRADRRKLRSDSTDMGSAPVAAPGRQRQPRLNAAPTTPGGQPRTQRAGQRVQAAGPCAVLAPAGVYGSVSPEFTDANSNVLQPDPHATTSLPTSGRQCSCDREAEIK